MTPIRVMIVDDHELIRSGLRMAVAGCSDIEICAEAGSGDEALELLEESRPQILLTDISMPRVNGLELTERVREGYPAIRVVLLSMHSEREYVQRAFRAGAAGYLVKEGAVREVAGAIRAVARGEYYLSSAISGHLVDEYVRLSAQDERGADPLTPRQREILVLIARGLTTKAIARRLGISVKTAETHRVQLMDRLRIHDVAGLVRHAIRIGLVRLDD